MFGYFLKRFYGHWPGKANTSLCIGFSFAIHTDQPHIVSFTCIRAMITQPQDRIFMNYKPKVSRAAEFGSVLPGFSRNSSQWSSKSGRHCGFDYTGRKNRPKPWVGCVTNTVLEWDCRHTDVERWAKRKIRSKPIRTSTFNFSPHFFSDISLQIVSEPQEELQTHGWGSMISLTKVCGFGRMVDRWIATLQHGNLENRMAVYVRIAVFLKTFQLTRSSC